MTAADTEEQTKDTLAAATEAASKAPERVLNQDETDSLPRSQVDVEPGPRPHGTASIVTSAPASHEPQPILES